MSSLFQTEGSVMARFLYIWIILLISVTEVRSGEYCSYTSDGYTSTMYCSNGCCGGDYDRYCCPGKLNVRIIGITVGVIALVLIIVGVLVAIYYCCRHSPGHTGQIFMPAVTATVYQAPPHGVQTATTHTDCVQTEYSSTIYPKLVHTSNIPTENSPCTYHGMPQEVAVNNSN